MEEAHASSTFGHAPHAGPSRYHDGRKQRTETAVVRLSLSRTLPSSTSPCISLRLATPTQRLQHSYLSAPAWKGPLPSADAFLRREILLHNTTLTRDGGITGWVLVDKEGHVLMGCESIRKRGLLARAGQGQVEEAIVHSVGAVYCPERHRGRGYARRLMDELVPWLEGWQRKEGQPVISVLYSEIGRDFYARHGWHPYASKHIRLPIHPTLPIVLHDDGIDWPENTQPILAEGVPELASRDELLIRQRLARKGLAAGIGGKNAFALVPDAETVEWFQARESFVYGELHDGDAGPMVRGAVVRDAASGKARAWCFWTCMWFEAEKVVRGQNTLYILRMAVDDDELGKAQRHHQGHHHLDGGGSVSEAAAAAVAALFEAAKRYAARWGMSGVEVWNPDDLMLRAAEKAMEGEVEVVERMMDSIPCLKVFGGQDHDTVEWVANEKFGWC